MGCVFSREDCRESCCLRGCLRDSTHTSAVDVRKSRWDWRRSCCSCFERSPRRPRSPTNKPIPQISNQTNGVQMVPLPDRDAQGRPIEHSSQDLDRETIIKGLEDVAAYLRNQGVTIQAITVGGAVDTLYMRSRKATHGVDFFLPDSSDPQHDILRLAAQEANRKRGGSLGGEWLNNATQVFMGKELQKEVARETFEQGVVVFEDVRDGGGFRVFAASWPLAICGKLNRLVENSLRMYDVEDAVMYLNEYIDTNDMDILGANEVLTWCEKYRKQGTKEVLQRVNEAYFKHFGMNVIDLQA